MEEMYCPPIDVLFVGYENQENLGLRSMISVLEERGFRAELAPFTPGNEGAILAAVREKRPSIVGFSLIFQFTLKEFADLMAYLRQSGVKAHFTVGGHYPTLRPEVVLESIPQVDSLVRHEGELTILELLENLNHPQNWPTILGLAYRDQRKIVINAARPLIDNLDDLPWIFRDERPSSLHGIGVASMLASRGCLFNCSFCSIRQFYGSAPGPLRRIRSAGNVVADMKHLIDEKGIRVFVFQDDDFAARTISQRAWMDEFLAELERAGLVGNIGWKISCRVDDIEPDLLQNWIRHGLICVYLGVESGNETSLKILNKRVSVEQNLRAIDLLKQNDVLIGIGFMLFDPSSSVESIRENLSFLRQVAADGSFPVNFCKMLPYAGTPIERQLIQEGRLKNSISQPDYDFLDPNLDWYAFLVNRIFHRRNFDQLGLVSLLGAAQINHRLVRIFLPELFSPAYEAALQETIQKDNLFVLDMLESLLEMVVHGDIDKLLAEKQRLVELAEHTWREEARIEAEFSDWLVRYDPDLLRAFAAKSVLKSEG